MIDGSTTITITLVISLLGTVLMFGIWQGRVDTKLDNLVAMINKANEDVCQDVDELFDRVRDTDRRVNELGTRLTIVETQHSNNHRTRKKTVDTGE